MYDLIISPRALKQLKVLKREYRKAIGSAIEDIKEDPFLGKQLGRDLAGRLSFRIGVYRIVYLVNVKDQVINIVSAGHRSTIYK